MPVVDHSRAVRYAGGMALLRSLFWVALFLFFTFCFIVFFEYGSRDFVPGFKKEYGRIKSFVIAQTSKTTPPPADKKTSK
jgi:hypothetical protein